MMKKDAFYKVLDYETKHHMIAAGDRLVAGISGGADSICLLLILIRLMKEIPFSVTVVHINHQLRDEEAGRDQLFVEELCERHGIPCRVFMENVQEFAQENGLTLEEAGRLVRRKCFWQVLESENADKIVLAHHKNDNAETFLMNLARGTGLAGLGGIRPVAGPVIRPLLCLSRGEIEAWLVEQGLSWCTDSTNASDHYTRNRVRHHILPMLEEQVNAKTVDHLQETMEQMQQLKDFVDEQCQRAMSRCLTREREGTLLIHKELLEQEHPYLQSELLRGGLIQMSGQVKDVSQVHVESLRALLNKQVGRQIHLPYNIKALRVYEGICLQQDKEMQSCEAIELQIPGTTYIPWAEQTISCSVISGKKDISTEEMGENLYTKCFNYDIINDTVQIRTRRTGDFLKIDETGHRQKLKSWFINEKIPSADRDHMLLLAVGSEVLWIPGYRRSGSYLVTDTTKNILKIQIYGGKSNGRDSKSNDFRGRY